VVPVATTNDALVAAVDILPTILDALGVAWTDDVVQGHSVLPLATGTVSESDREFVVIESGYGKHSESGQTIALRRASTKYVHRLRQWALRPQGLGSVFWTTNARFEGGLKPDELYDLDADPEELDNVLAERRAFSLEERELLRAYAAYLYATGRRSAENPGELDAETYESLKSLGYL
jgi:arylsulfatase A-like enzyme